MLLRSILFNLYRINHFRVMVIVRRLINRFDGGEMFSPILRDIFRQFHDIEVGMYSHGGCFVPGMFDRYTTVGRYCSIAVTARVMNRNHPMESKSMHALFFNPRLGYSEKDSIEYIPLNIGHDVWIGHNAIIMPHVQNIGDGAVIGAGAIVNKDVPPYAIVVGNPGRVVRFRFSKETIEILLESRWWEKSIDELKPFIKDFQSSLGARELVETGSGKD